MTYLVEMLNIRKAFPGVIANDGVTLQVKKGEIHALLGENGAGKTTLMNILFGLYQPDEGEIRVKGQKVYITDPNVANDLGIGMVHQHFMLVDTFTVTQNIILGSEPTRLGRIHLAQAEREVQALSDKYGLSVNPKAKIRDISVGMQQRVEILKTLYRGADVLIFDEPTAVLTPQEVDELMAIMKSLVTEGKSIILITHKLKEIMQVCDRCTVIRKGKSVGTVEVRGTSVHELASRMVGRRVSFTTAKAPAKPKEVVLKIRNLVVKDARQMNAVKGLNLDVRAGEVVGVAGVDGNGQTELIEAITGLRKCESGSITLHGKPITNLSPRKVTESGLAHIPQDRHKYGLVLDFSVGENLVLQTYYQQPFSKNMLLNGRAIDEKAEQLIEEYDIRTSGVQTKTRALSGGNQQKAIIAREVDRSPTLLLAAQPTRGLDVGAIEFIHRKLVEERDKGKAILLISFELDEIIGLSDRIIVMFDGKIVADKRPEDTDEHELGLWMAGNQTKKKKRSGAE